MSHAERLRDDLRYVAHLDMLGMRELTVRNPDLAWGALSKLSRAKEEILRLQIQIVSSRVLIANRIQAFTFSDTIFLFSRSDEAVDTYAIVILCSELFARALHFSIPIRAGIAHGRCFFNLNHGLFAGPPLVASCCLSEEAQWLGIRVDSVVAARARAIPLLSAGESLIIDWKVPLKDGSAPPGPVVDWVRSHKRNFTLAPPISCDSFYAVAFEQLFGPLDQLPSTVRAKYENTVAFVNERLSLEATR